MSATSRNNEFMFPHSAVPELKNVRNGAWSDLVERVELLSEVDQESLAFSLMMIDLCGCLNCQPGGYRLSLGCGTCASRAVGAFKGPDSALLTRFGKAHDEIREYLAGADEVPEMKATGR